MTLFEKIKPSQLPKHIREQADNVLFFGMEESIRNGLVQNDKSLSLQHIVNNTFLNVGQARMWSHLDGQFLHVVYRSNKYIKVASIRSK